RAWHRAMVPQAMMALLYRAILCDSSAVLEGASFSPATIAGRHGRALRREMSSASGPALISAVVTIDIQRSKACHSPVILSYAKRRISSPLTRAARSFDRLRLSQDDR